MAPRRRGGEAELTPLTLGADEVIRQLKSRDSNTCRLVCRGVGNNSVSNGLRSVSLPSVTAEMKIPAGHSDL